MNLSPQSVPFSLEFENPKSNSSDFFEAPIDLVSDLAEIVPEDVSDTDDDSPAVRRRLFRGCASFCPYRPSVCTHVDTVVPETEPQFYEEEIEASEEETDALRWLHGQEKAWRMPVKSKRVFEKEGEDDVVTMMLRAILPKYYDPKYYDVVRFLLILCESHFICLIYENLM